MSSTKVNDTTNVGHSTSTASMFKLGNAVAGSVGNVTSSVGSGGVGTSTDQFLPNTSLPQNETAAAFVAEQETVYPTVVLSVMDASTIYSANFGDHNEATDQKNLSQKEAGQQVETYEKVMDAFEVITGKTRGFG
ncbi:MAG: hypothetical protein MJ247_07315 [Alphaproteobacteria bacterium]|nr:hypothetical protein [Alphaproteobacteria bacterium]